jgi:dTDP-4-dehydrorhamnose reductase
MKLFITGASGLYGSKLSQIATGRQHQVYSLDIQNQAAYGMPIQLDITDKTQVNATFQRLSPEVVIHAAGLTDVDKCELNRELAWKTNVEGTINIAQAAKTCGAFVIYISTDYVFDGEKGNYTETDLPSPISYYGYTKLKAEEQIRKILTQYCIARTSVIYGAVPAAGKVNFALWLLSRLTNKEQTRVFTDQWNSPTLNTSLAKMTLEIAERKLSGTYHLAGATRISRYDFAMFLAKTFNLDTSLLVPILSKDLKFPAKRPKDSSLNTVKAQQILKNKPLPIDKALSELKIELKEHIGKPP